MTDPMDHLIPSEQFEAEWLAGVEAAPAACKCGHPEHEHALSTGRCRSVVCGCTRMRPREVKAPPHPYRPPAPVRRGLPELVVCPAGCHKGQVYEDPDLRGVWCPRCWGAGVVDGTS